MWTAWEETASTKTKHGSCLDCETVLDAAVQFVGTRESPRESVGEDILSGEGEGGRRERHEGESERKRRRAAAGVQQTSTCRSMSRTVVSDSIVRRMENENGRCQSE